MSQPEPPPELTGFHARNMRHIAVLFGIVITIGGSAMYRQETMAAEDELQTALVTFCVCGIGAFMIAVLYKALCAKPECPACRIKMPTVETITLRQPAAFGTKCDRVWRVVCCPRCGGRHRVPGLSPSNDAGT